MRALALALALLSAASVAAQMRVVKPNVYEKKKRDAGPGPTYLLNLALSGDCEGTTPAGFTFTRATAATCPKADGTVVSLSSGQARVTSRGVLRENAATNLVLHNRDASQAAWLKTNSTCTKTATGTDGVANSASTCTATSASGTVLQGITASGSRNSSLYIKRRTGSGVVEVTRDGSTWISVTASVSGSWVRLSPLTHSGLTGSVTNPVIGVRLTTSGDAVDIDRVQDEAATVASSPIDTAGTSATRNNEVVTYATPVGLSTTEGCSQICLEPSWTGAKPTGTQLYIGIESTSTTRLFWASTGATTISTNHSGGTTPVAADYVAGTTKCYRASWSAAGNAVTMTNVTSGASTTQAFTAYSAFDATFGLGASATGTSGVNAFISLVRFHTTPTGCL